MLLRYTNVTEQISSTHSVKNVPRMKQDALKISIKHVMIVFLLYPAINVIMPQEAIALARSVLLVRKGVILIGRKAVLVACRWWRSTNVTEAMRSILNARHVIRANRDATRIERRLVEIVS